MNKHVVITGASRGIGLELCRQYADDGWRVTGVCRQAADALLATGARVIDSIDVASDASLQLLVAALAEDTIDLLVNCAGILQVETLEDLDIQSIRDQFEVNALGPLRITHALIPLMAEPSKVAMITSRMGSIADNSSGARYGYRGSKAALNAFSKSLAIDLADRGISVTILHPGWVQTDMTGHTGDVSAEESAGNLRQRIAELTPETSGQFWHAKGEPLPW